LPVRPVASKQPRVATAIRRCLDIIERKELRRSDILLTSPGAVKNCGPLDILEGGASERAEGGALVARHSKHKRKTLDTGTVPQRAERALQEGRFGHARELAMALLHQNDTPAHRDLALRASLGRANQLQGEARFMDAAGVLRGILPYLQDPTQMKLVAESLARCGDFTHAVQLAEKAGDPQLMKRLVELVVDADLRDRGRGKVQVPENLVAQRAIFRQAFTELYAGQDEQVAATLQGIGLGSPYLEWKLLVRGLLAYYQEDDVRAVENWQRLNPQRLPFRVAAPFRASIDPAYRKAQPPETQQNLATQLERLHGSGKTGPLRQVQLQLAGGKPLSQAFRQVESLVATWKVEAPHLVQRLAACFFWAIIDRGYPEDVQRYQRVFGAPPEDPHLSRLEALAMEHRMEFDGAHEAWQNYERGLASRLPTMPAEQVQRMRALIWQHMGHYAASAADDDDLRQLPFEAPFSMRRPPALKPSAEECFAKSLQLAPDLLSAHLALVQFYLDHDKKAKALQAAKQLLKRFPEHVPTLTTAGDLSLEKANYNEALELFTRALQANPLDGRLRTRLCSANTAAAGEEVAKGHFEDARRGFQTALGLAEAEDKSAILGSWAACEFKAGATDQGEQLLQQASAAGGQRLAIAFQMLVSAIRFKLGKPLKTRFEKEFNGLLAEPTNVAAAVAMAHISSGLARAGVKYVGQKGHEKKVIAYIDRARNADFTDDQLLHLCTALRDLKSVRLLQSFFQTGQQRFPGNPRFYLAEVEYLLSLPPHRINPIKVKMLLDKIRELAAALPVVEREAVLKRVQECEEDLREANPFGSLFDGMDPGRLFDFMGGPDDFDEEDDDDDDW
jgi:tetratricopeptide (TPR) repeat protein